MPMMWVDAYEFLTHKGVTIYHSYKNDDVDQGPREFWYCLLPWHGEDEAFDVRDLSTWYNDPEGTDIKKVLRDAINKGELKAPPDEGA